LNIRQCTLDDSKQICDIYNYYIKNTIITFEETLVTAQIMAQRIETYTQQFPWLVLEDEKKQIVGYAYANKLAERSAFQHSVEMTVYLHHEAGGKGYGKALYKALLSLLAKAEFHVAIAVISLPNHPSVKLHESFGFNQVGHFSQVGRKFDQWIDVGYWQVMLKDNF